LTPRITKVSFPPSFVCELQVALMGIPNSTFQGSSANVEVAGERYTIAIRPEDIRAIADLQQAVQSRMLKDSDQLIFQAIKDEKILELILQKDDIEALIFVIDKVTSGADPVSLDGEINISLVPTNTNK
jgi:hypothetical protein